MTWAATAIFGGALVSAAATTYGANKASQAQQSAAQMAANTQMQMYQQTRKDLAPYRAAGAADLATLQSELPFLTSPIKMDEATLEQTPGYQFTLAQGLKAVQNSAAARGLGVSGAAQKGAAAYATGLADNTYQTQFNLENINRSNAYNRLINLVNMGQSAAGQTANASLATGQGVGSAEIAGGNAAAAGYNAFGGAGQTIANAGTTYALYKGLYNRNNSLPVAPVAQSNDQNFGDNGVQTG